MVFTAHNYEKIYNFELQIIDMANTDKSSAPLQNNNANETSHYKLMTVGIVIGLAGVFGRFVQDSSLASGIANVLLLIGSVVSIKAVLNILK